MVIRMIYGCEYRFRGDKRERTISFNAKNENEARLKMMKFAEKEDVFVQNIGRELSSKSKNKREE